MIIHDYNPINKVAKVGGSEIECLPLLYSEFDGNLAILFFVFFFFLYVTPVTMPLVQLPYSFKCGLVFLYLYVIFVYVHEYVPMNTGSLEVQKRLL